MLGSWDRSDRAGAEAWLGSLGDEGLQEVGLWQVEDGPPPTAGRQDPSEVMQWLGSETREGAPDSSFHPSQYWTAAELPEARETLQEALQR